MTMASINFGGYKRIVRYVWDPEPTNHDFAHFPIWCLGHKYSRLEVGDYHQSPSLYQKTSYETNQTTAAVADDYSVGPRNESGLENRLHVNSEDDRGWPKEFLDDFESRFWFTYRSNFPLIRKLSNPAKALSNAFGVRLRSQHVDHGGFTSDVGWGCMIRSGQCLIANTLAMLRLGRDWRRGARIGEEKELLMLFADHPEAPFSLHKFVEYGAMACGKYPGEWFGPSATARCIQNLTQKYKRSGFKVYVTGDGADVYMDSLFDLAKEDGLPFCPVLILVGIRLGIDTINPVYWNSLRASLQTPQSIGIAGGRPSSSHYFVGVQGDCFFYLDPHQARTAIPWHESSDEYSSDVIDSCHTRRLRKLCIKDIDPSMLIAFLIRDEEDWYQWRTAINNSGENPLVNISDTQITSAAFDTRKGDSLDEVLSFDDEEDGEDAWSNKNRN